MNALHLARAADPLTSHHAAQRVERFAPSHYERILDAMSHCLLERPEQGATAAEIAAWADLTVVQVDRRLPELRKLGRVAVLTHDDGADVVRMGYRCWTRV